MDDRDGRPEGMIAWCPAAWIWAGTQTGLLARGTNPPGFGGTSMPIADARTWRGLLTHGTDPSGLEKTSTIAHGTSPRGFEGTLVQGGELAGVRMSVWATAA